VHLRVNRCKSNSKCDQGEYAVSLVERLRRSELIIRWSLVRVQPAHELAKTCLEAIFLLDAWGAPETLRGSATDEEGGERVDGAPTCCAGMGGVVSPGNG
jgi:hypothetical protein